MPSQQGGREIYLNNQVRPFVDKEIEALAQAISKNTREGVPTYGVSTTLQYVFGKLLARVLKIKYKEINDNTVATGEAALAGAAQEFNRRIVEPYNEKQKNLNGDVWGELL